MSGLALFGGTFDPIHNAHLKIAAAAADACGLPRILFIPAGAPPHRTEGTVAPYEDRFAMVALACQADARFEPSRLEETGLKNYSIDTIERVRSVHAGPLHFLIGADAFAEIRTWHRWRDVVAQVIFIVVSRPGAQYQVPEGAAALRLEEIELSVSSSQIRADLAAGAAEVPVPAAVRRYIESRGLYGHHSRPNL